MTSRDMPELPEGISLAGEGGRGLECWGFRYWRDLIKMISFIYFCIIIQFNLLAKKVFWKLLGVNVVPSSVSSTSFFAKKREQKKKVCSGMFSVCHSKFARIRICQAPESIWKANFRMLDLTKELNFLESFRFY